MAREHNNKQAARAAAAAEPLEDELLGGITGGIFTPEEETEAAFKRKGRKPYETLQDLIDDAERGPRTKGRS